MQNINRHVWKLLAAVGVALMAYAWADEEFNQAEFGDCSLYSCYRCLDTQWESASVRKHAM